MSAEQNMAVMRRVAEEGFSKGNLDALDDCFPPTFIEHQFDLPPTLDGLKGTIRWLRETYSDFQLRVDDIAADGDKVWVRLTGSGKHSGELMGRPPTGKSFEITVFDVCRFEDGKIVEHWGVPDRFHQMVQLGLIPSPTPTADAGD